MTAVATAAIATAGVVSAGGAGAGAAGIAAVESAAGQSVRANLARGKAAARKGKRDDAWRGVGLKRLKQVREQAVNCAVNSYGDVRQFFLRAPCRSLERMLFTLTDGSGGSIVVSVVWVGMPTTDTAQQLRALADTDGTGNVAPLASGLVGAAGVEFTGRYYDSRRTGKLVVIAEAEPLSGKPDAEFLDGAAELAVQFPPP